MRHRLAVAVFSSLLLLPAGAAARVGGDTLLVQFDNGRVATVDAGSGQVQSLGLGSTASWSPDGRRIALSRDGDIFVLTADGRRGRRLTHDDLVQFGPVWSPDGTRIAFLQQHPEMDLGVGPQDDVVVANLASGVTRQLTADARLKAALSWSPDGTQLVYESVGRSLRRPIVVIDASTGETVQSATVRPYPMWSPDGRRIAYVTVNGERAAVVVAQADGSSPRVLFRGAVDIDVYDVSWSPSSRFLAFTYGGWSVSHSRLEVADVDSGRIRALTPILSHDSAPSWAPDSRRLAFARFQPGRKRYAVAVIDRTGHNLRLVVQSGHFAQPLWRPSAH